MAKAAEFYRNLMNNDLYIVVQSAARDTNEPHLVIQFSEGQLYHNYYTSDGLQTLLNTWKLKAIPNTNYQIKYYYPSESKGNVEISSMNEVHLRNAIYAARRDGHTSEPWYTHLCVEAGKRGIIID